ncbi:MAG: hypothetical protein JRI25_29305, partial [Deltaproteobacteria bacterium]|nr:hypothetical protein [Deltaproteobacteria bacterium]
MHALFFAVLFSWIASAQTNIFSGTVQGGVSVDGQGVDANWASSGWICWSDYGNQYKLQVQIPTGSTITHLYAIVHPKWGGFYRAPAGDIKINGTPLTSATLLVNQTWRKVYQLDPGTFGITGAGNYGYCEQHGADNGNHSGSGIGGTVLVAIYTHPTLSGRRHVLVSYDWISNATHTFSGMPTSGASAQQALSVALMWECSNEQ